MPMRSLYVFLLGGLGYVGLELLCRGRSHPSMFFAGGLGVVLLVSLYGNRELGPVAAFVLGALILSAVEFLFGYVFNLRLKKKVWDYSDLPCNLYGQVCLRYSLLWGTLSLLLYALM